MNNDDLKKYIEDLKKLEKNILSEDTDLNFMGELNSLLGN